MDKVLLGQRLAQAREDADMTQEALGRAVNLDRTAITRLERGERKLSATELIEIADALGRPLSYFTRTQIPAVVSRRTAAATAHETTRALDDELEQFAGDIAKLLAMGMLTPVEREADAHTPRNHRGAEAMATRYRRKLDLGVGPVDDLGDASERLGLLVYSAPLGNNGPDGGCVEVSPDLATLGAAVINGDAPSGRRRMTLAHELGHWLCGDAFDVEAGSNAEQMINSFAIHFLAPRAGVQAMWSEEPKWNTYERALLIGARFRLSWSATIGQLRNIELIDYEDYSTLARSEPRRGDYMRLGLNWPDELGRTYLSPRFTTACLNAYVEGRLTSGRTVELMRGTLSEDGLPPQRTLSLDDFRYAFDKHNG